MRLSIAALGLGLLAAAAPHSTAAQTSPADSTRIERLAALGRLWVSIQYFHPWLAYRQINWDAALVAAVPKVSAAGDRAAYAAAVREMLARLGDPVTAVAPDGLPAVEPSRAEPDPRSWWTEDSVLVVSLRNAADLGDFNRAIERLGAIADTIRRARRVVLDLRGDLAAEPTGSPLDYVLGESELASLFTATPARGPDQRGRAHSGFVPEVGTTSGGYSSGFYTVSGATVAPGDSAASTRSAVVLVNDRSFIPEALLALREAGRARIVAERGAGEAGVVRTYEMSLPDSLTVTVRLTELLRGGSAGSAVADTVVDSAVPGAAWFRSRWSERRESALWPVAPPAAARSDSAAEAPYPALPYRLMAAYRIWAVGRYFFPYRDLIREPWDRVLAEALPRLEAARDSLEYGLAVAEMATHLHDSHVRVTSPTLRARFGVARAPVYVRIIEGRPVISHFIDDSAGRAARAAGARAGDVIVAVDGEDALARLRRLERYISASTPQALRRNAAFRLTGGAEGSSVRLRLRGPRGERTVTMTRTSGEEGVIGRSGPVFRVLPGNIGYADLARLEVGQVDSMFAALAGTRAIVFDMRGYPNGTAWSIAPRLTKADRPVGARFSRPYATSPDTTEWAEQGFAQQLPPTDDPRYLRPTVMLIDERTQSQAEHTGLFFEAANGTRFIGSPTAGANGDVTTIRLPGGLLMSFSGQAVRHADGRQLQRVGLVPDVPVRPTIAGIRTGRDEVLERALAWVRGR